MRIRDDNSLGVDVSTLRKLFKGLEQWRAFREDFSVDTFVYEGREWHIMDIEMLYRASQTLLAPRQAQAIELHLVGNLREADVARLMGISPTNPIGMYATDGLKHIVAMIEEGLLP